MKKKKIAIVNQRYGVEVNGGSEQYTRMIAERLQKYYDVEVLTTCALNYDTWEDYYTEGTEKINGVSVRRFRVKRPRNLKRFHFANLLAYRVPFARKLIENRWVKEQGPYAPQLLDYIEENIEQYDVVIFVTYLYYLTAKGLPRVAEKSILIPTAHDEPYIRYGIYREVFEGAKGLIYLTEAEKELVESRFAVAEKRNEVIAVGVDVPQKTDGEAFRKKYQIAEPYFIYVGRVDLGKNCDELFEWFRNYKKHVKSSVKLVLLGKCMMDIPEEEDIVSLGFVSEEDKYDGMAGARALIMPSAFESLSLVVLESLSLKTPVLVNGQCEVLKKHCLQSNAGIAYDGYEEFEEGLNFFMTDSEEYLCMKENGTRYVKERYTWDSVEKKLAGFIENI